MPDTLVEELSFAETVFLFDAGEADGFGDGNLSADGLRVDERLAVDRFGVFLEHLEAEVAHSGLLQFGQQLERGLRLAYEQRVAAFRVALQKVTFALVVQNFDLVLGANLAAFREPPAAGKRAGERAVFGMECGHVLVEGEFRAAAVDVA